LSYERGHSHLENDSRRDYCGAGDQEGQPTIEGLSMAEQQQLITKCRTGKPLPAKK
jgi:hypothetical protein